MATMTVKQLRAAFAATEKALAYHVALQRMAAQYGRLLRGGRPMNPNNELDRILGPSDNVPRFEVKAAAIALRGEVERLRAALRRIVDEPCDHGPGFCPREVAADALAGGVAEGGIEAIGGQTR